MQNVEMLGRASSFLDCLKRLIAEKHRCFDQQLVHKNYILIYLIVFNKCVCSSRYFFLYTSNPMSSFAFLMIFLDTFWRKDI